MFTRNLFLPSPWSHDISAFVLVPALKCVNLILSYRFYFLPFSLSVFIVLSLYVLSFMLFFSSLYSLFMSSIILFISFLNLFIIFGLCFYLRHPFLCFVIHLLLFPPSIHFANGIAILSRFVLELVRRMRADWKDSTFKTRQI